MKVVLTLPETSVAEPNVIPPFKKPLVSAVPPFATGNVPVTFEPDKLIALSGIFAAVTALLTILSVEIEFTGGVVVTCALFLNMT